MAFKKGNEPKGEPTAVAEGEEHKMGGKERSLHRTHRRHGKRKGGARK